MKSVLKKILLIGNSPLPSENEQVRPAAGLRTWQFLKPLSEQFDVRLVTIAMPECYKSEIVEGLVDADGGKIDETIGAGVDLIGRKKIRFTIHKDNPRIKKILQEIHDEFQPEVIIGVNTYPSYVACSLNSHAPLWADLNGWIMAEAQAQAYKMGANDYLGHYFEMERVVVGRADKFSAVSQAEGFALLGELADAGRLNKESFGYKFVEHVPNGMEWFEGEDMGGMSVTGERVYNVCTNVGAWKGGRQEENESSHKQQSVTGDRNKNLNGLNKPKFELKSVPGQTLPKDAFVLLWLGGYNTWVDEFTLFKAVNEAMVKCGKLYFVSTGGGIAGLDNSTFAKFKKMIEGSEYKERFVFLGWVETAEIPALYKRAQAGVNVDRRCTETLTGARNRINEMMKFGLPVVTTKGSEIADEVDRVGAGMAVKSGDHAALSGAIEKLYNEWRGGGGRETVKFKEYGKKGREYIEKYCNYEETLKPLLVWLENPRPAPDRGVRISGFSGGIFGGRIGSGAGKFRGGILSRLQRLPNLPAMWRYLKQNGFKKSFKKFLQRMRG